MLPPNVYYANVTLIVLMALTVLKIKLLTLMIIVNSHCPFFVYQIFEYVLVTLTISF